MGLAIHYHECDLRSAEKRFIAACAEMIWPVAHEAIVSVSPISMSRLASHAALGAAFQQFVCTAPSSYVRDLRYVPEGTEAGDASSTLDAWRKTLLAALSDSHLKLASDFIAQDRYDEAHAHTAAAIMIRGRTPRHESLLVRGVERLAAAVGQLEAADPETASFAPAYALGTADPEGYSPEILADLIERLVTNGASDEAIAGALRTFVTHVRSPSLFALTRIDARHREVLSLIGSRQLTESPALSPLARGNLLALLRGISAEHGPTRSDGTGS